MDAAPVGPGKPMRPETVALGLYNGGGQCLGAQRLDIGERCGKNRRREPGQDREPAMSSSKPMRRILPARQTRRTSDRFFRQPCWSAAAA
jgi:hypothetical protein